MALNSEERRYIESVLDRCDAALSHKPRLASIFDHSWRKDLRDGVSKIDSMLDFGLPTAYVAADKPRIFPDDFQYRLDEGAAILLPKIDDGERNHFISRMRGTGCTSAEEELLLARGFAGEFSADAILPPSRARDAKGPEFYVLVDGTKLAVEAKGVLDSVRVQGLRRATLEAGQNVWITGDTTPQDLKRLRERIVKKIKNLCSGVPSALVVSQYTAWPPVPDALPLIRDIALKPNEYGIPNDLAPAMVTYVCQLMIQGIYANRAVAAQYGLSDAVLNRVKRAATNSFYPRIDGFVDRRNWSLVRTCG